MIWFDDMTVAVIADTWKLHQARHNLLAWKLKLQSNSLDEQGNVRELDGLTDNSVSLSLFENGLGCMYVSCYPIHHILHGFCTLNIYRPLQERCFK